MRKPRLSPADSGRPADEDKTEIHYSHMRRIPSSLLGLAALVLALLSFWWWRSAHENRDTRPIELKSSDGSLLVGRDLAERDFKNGKRKILIYGLNTSRQPLPPEIVSLGLYYEEVAGCSLSPAALAGFVEYNARMRELIKKQTGVDLSLFNLR